MPHPLHPAVVHFPVVLAVLLPFLTLAGVVFTRGTSGSRRAWWWVVAFAVLLPLSGWAALETGEEQAEVVEAVVAEAPVHRHEEAAEGFLAGAALLATLALAGLLPGKPGAAARMSSVPVAVAVLALGVRVGASGGDLVYRYGAAAAYVSPAGGAVPAGHGRDGEARDDDDGRRGHE